jgi:hypothetical protein
MVNTSPKADATLTPETYGFRHLPFQGIDPRTTDTEGRTLDGGSCTAAADAVAGCDQPWAGFVALRV